MARETFHYHKVNKESAVRMTEVRAQFIELADYLEYALPDGRSKSLCFTHLEDACMRAIQAEALEHGELLACRELTT